MSSKLSVSREDLIKKYTQEGCRKDDIKQLFPLFDYQKELRAFVNDVIVKSRSITLAEAKFIKTLKGSEAATIIEAYQ